MNKSSPHGGTIIEGTISSGTLRTQDLLRAFADEIERLLPFNGRAHAADAREWADLAEVEMSKDYTTTAGSTVLEDAAIALAALQDELNIIAERDGFYFGAHPGDGADFGFWKIELDD